MVFCGVVTMNHLKNIPDYKRVTTNIGKLRFAVGLVAASVRSYTPEMKLVGEAS